MVAQIDKKYIITRPYKLWSRLLSYGLFEGRPLTTSGQWINPVLFMLFNIYKKIPMRKKTRAPVFILGTGRSGTTILGVVLSIHKDVGFLNEPKAIWHSIHPNEDLIGSYSRLSGRYRLFEHDATADIISNAHKLFCTYLATSFSRRVVDKYPELIFRVPFVKAIFPDAKFLFLTRNGWDTCHSIESWSNRLGDTKFGEVHDWWGANNRKWNLLLDQIVPEHLDISPHIESMRNWNNQTNMAALEWIVTMREGLQILNQFPNDVKLIRYEALCENPREVLNQISQFCSLDGSDEVFLNYGATVLKPVKQKKPFLLEQAIEAPFIKTMNELGY